ncbi:MAG: dTDP-4-dehydrorhamnose 3,5-epimerase [Euryarchaeota archaeon]|nr:dTDP-4-dehydrorhamnose 3,5-epimerase [Euryarchaeota archaeon]|tara:strand:- start:15413 stop:15949 length:537 start_codon:yes stop_codon:yes gene_type:complete
MDTKKIFSDVILIPVQNFRDDRGSFKETFNKLDFENIGLFTEFTQDNVSFSKLKGTLRGLHYQKDEFSQTKLVSVLCGSIYDVFLDIRPNSNTFGQFGSLSLDPDAGSILIPKGFAHGFCTLEDNTIVSYKVDNYYNKDSESGVIWNDKELNINWPIDGDPIISNKDRELPSFADLGK